MDDFELVFNTQEPSVFHITVQGELGDQWSEYFNAQSISVEPGKSGQLNTILVSEPIDQAALVGLINRLNGLGIKLVSVEPEY